MSKRDYGQKNGKNSERRKKASVGEDADWGEVNEQFIRELIRIVTRTGGAVRFGYTKDGDTYAVGLYDSGDSWTEYCNDSKDVEQWLVGLAESWGE